MRTFGGDLAIQHRVGWFVALALIALVAAPRASFGAGAIADSNVTERLATAKTAADYNALAAYFRAKAAHAGMEVKKHEAMLKAVSGKPLESWGPHCQEFITSDTAMQKSYEKAAAELEEAAKNAPQ